MTSIRNSLAFFIMIVSSGSAFALSKEASLKSKEFSVPLRFQVLGDGVEMPPLELDYDLTAQNTIKLGEFSLNTENFQPQVMAFKGKTLKYLLLQWPEFLIPTGDLEMIGQSGRVLWKSDIGPKAKALWQIKAKKMGLKSPWGLALTSDDSQNPFLKAREPFRFCLSRTEDQAYSRACTFLYEVRRSSKGYQLAVFPKSPGTARVIAFNEAAPLKDTKPVKTDQPVQFFAETSNGITYEFASKPVNMNLVEILALPDGKTASVSAWGGAPLQSYTPMAEKTDGYFTKLLGFQQTIGDFRQFWETHINLSNPVLYIPGSGGGMFRQRFIITKLPTESIRPYAHYRTPEAAYTSNFKIFGRKSKELKLSSTENSLETDSNQKDFTWYFKSEKRGELNRSYFNVGSGDQQFKAYYELYKGYPRELSTRLTGIISSEGKTVLMGEVAFQYWFEDIFGWTNYYLARQRWGLSTKYFQSLSSFAIGNYSDDLKVTTVDLKYRLAPGLWNRDETLGLIGGYQNFQYSTFVAPMFGGGAFWARSMPRVFDDIFNWFPFFRYPKWVDMEFIAYGASTDPSVRVNIGTYSLNFHGKVMWTNSIFGEAGFGLKQYSFDDLNRRLSFRFTSLYGTVGLGLNF